MALCDKCGTQKLTEKRCPTCSSYENQLGEQVRPFSDTFSAMEVIKREFFPSRADSQTLAKVWFVSAAITALLLGAWTVFVFVYL